MQIKTTMRYHLTRVRMGIIKNSTNKQTKKKKKNSTNNKIQRECGEKGTSYTIGGDINWYSHYGKQYGDSLKN